MQPPNDGELLLIDMPLYKLESGSFVIARNIVDGRYKLRGWTRCRDYFHTEITRSKIFFFSHETQSEHVIDFMRQVEENLKVKPKSKFGITQRNTVLWVLPSKWWLSSMRRSLFTILLRAGRHHISEEDFKKSLFSEAYCSDTTYAVNRFFSGYTYYTGKKRGWYKQFYELRPSQEEVDLLLVKPS